MTRLLLADIDGRARGKTTRAVTWLLEGKQTRKYPGWDRVLLVPNTLRFDHVRKSFEIEDVPHRVFTFEQWRRMHRGHSVDAEVFVDDADVLLPHGNVVGFAASGQTTGQPGAEVVAYRVVGRTLKMGDRDVPGAVNFYPAHLYEEWINVWLGEGCTIEPLVVQEQPS